jgi:hypothetical protein
MICAARQRVWKIFELNKYRQLFTIPIATCTAWFPGNIDMVLYDIISGRCREIERSFKIYCKLDGQLKKQFSLRGSIRDSVRFCACDRLVIQKQYPEEMQIFDISSEVPRLIRRIDVFPLHCPVFLDKKRQFICKINNLQGELSGSVDAFNLQGESLRFGGRSVTLRDLPDSFSFFCITKNQDVGIFVSTVPLRININSIRTGQSLGNIRVNDPMSSWNEFEIEQFAYDQRTHEIFLVNFEGKCCIWSNKFFEHD